MSNDNASSRKNSLGMVVAIVLALWLTGLSALFLMFIKNQKDNPLEARIAKLEAKASRVVGKIKKPGTTAANNDIGMLNKRISQLELQFAEVKPGNITTASPGTDDTTAASAPVKTAAVSDSSCDCNEFAGRLDKLEAMLLAQKSGTARKTVSKSIKPKGKVKARAKHVRKSRKTIVKKYKRKSPQRAKPAVTASVKTGTAEKTAPAKTKKAAFDYSETDHIGDSVYEMSRRFGPMYGGYTNEELASLRRLAPGAAIYPGSSIGNYETLTDY